MANLKLNNVVVVAESSGTATLQNSIIKVKAYGIKASDGTAAITISDSTGAVALASTLAVTGTSTLTGNVTASGNLTVTGDLTVSGTTTTVDTALTVSDAMVINNAGSDVGLKINSTSTGNIIQLQDGGVDKFTIADGGAITAVGNLGLTGATTLTGSLSVSTTSIFTGDTTHNGNVVMNKNKKLKQQGAFMQSSTHQALVLGL